MIVYDIECNSYKDQHIVWISFKIMTEGIKIIPVGNEPESLLELAQEYGVDTSKVEFSMVFSFDEEMLQFIPQPVKAIFFIFPIGPKDGYIQKRHMDDKPPSGDIPYYTHQTVTDLCGTMAMIHNMMNNRDILPFKKGSWAERFYEKTKLMNPDERAEVISKDTELFELHNKVSTKCTAPLLAGKTDTHFGCFLEHGGNIWELDGRKPQPINHGKAENLLKQFGEILTKEFLNNLEGNDKHRISIVSMSAKQ